MLYIYINTIWRCFFSWYQPPKMMCHHSNHDEPSLIIMTHGCQARWWPGMVFQGRKGSRKAPKATWVVWKHGRWSVICPGCFMIDHASLLYHGRPCHQGIVGKFVVKILMDVHGVSSMFQWGSIRTQRTTIPRSCKRRHGGALDPGWYCKDQALRCVWSRCSYGFVLVKSSLYEFVWLRNVSCRKRMYCVKISSLWGSIWISLDSNDD